MNNYRHIVGLNSTLKIALLLCFFRNVPAYSQTFEAVTPVNDDSEYTDLTAKMGVLSGHIEGIVEKKSGNRKTLSYGGVVIACAYNIDYNFLFSGYVEGIIVTDVRNETVATQGVNGGIIWHMIGGPKILRRESKFGSQIWRNSYELSLVGSLGIHNFSLSDKNSPDMNLTGSVLETRSGILYRYDLGEKIAIGAELNSTVYTLPASVDRLKPRSTAFSMLWRVLF